MYPFNTMNMPGKWLGLGDDGDGAMWTPPAYGHPAPGGPGAQGGFAGPLPGARNMLHNRQQMQGAGAAMEGWRGVQQQAANSAGTWSPTAAGAMKPGRANAWWRRPWQSDYYTLPPSIQKLHQFSEVVQGLKPAPNERGGAEQQAVNSAGTWSPTAAGATEPGRVGPWRKPSLQFHNYALPSEALGLRRINQEAQSEGQTDKSLFGRFLEEAFPLVFMDRQRLQDRINNAGRYAVHNFKGQTGKPLFGGFLEEAFPLVFMDHQKLQDRINNAGRYAVHDLSGGMSDIVQLFSKIPIALFWPYFSHFFDITKEPSGMWKGWKGQHGKDGEQLRRELQNSRR